MGIPSALANSFVCSLRPLGATILAFLLATTPFGCTTKKTREVTAAELRRPQNEHIIRVTTNAGEEIQFDDPGARVGSSTLQGSVRGQSVEIALADVQRYWVLREETSKSRTIGLVAGIVGGALLLTAAIAVATKNSCPFVYSWDGQHYVFDAEPYGGAITRGLERDDYAELQHIKPGPAGYRLLLTNEVPETQYTNLTELQIVDHPSGSRVVVDRAGAYFTTRNLIPPLSAIDGSGKDLRRWLAQTDGLIWEPLDFSAERLRETLVLTFPKPPHAKRAKLVVNLATGLWGSYMIREVLKLRGQNLPAWYEEVDSDPRAVEKIHEWGRLTESYALRVYLETGDQWKPAAVLLGEGPFISEHRMLVIDLDSIEGDTLRLKMNPPVGFWAFNSFAVDYSEDEPLRITTLKPVRAVTSDGRDVLKSLSKIDNDYYAMPEIGNQAELVFASPLVDPERSRTVFLKSRGYYRLHFEGQGTPEVDALGRLADDPEFIHRFAAQLFRAWNPQLYLLKGSESPQK